MLLLPQSPLPDNPTNEQNQSFEMGLNVFICCFGLELIVFYLTLPLAFE